MNTRLFALVALLLLSFAARGIAGQVALLVSDSDTLVVSGALEGLKLPDGIRVTMYSPHMLDTSKAAREQVTRSDVIVVDVMIDELARFVIEHVDPHVKRVYAVRGSRDDDALKKRGIIFDREILRYYDNQVEANIRNLVRRVVHNEFDRFVLPEKVKRTPKLGLYHPDAHRVFTGTAEYFQWLRSRRGYDPKAPVVAVITYRAGPRPGQIEYLNYVIRRLERAGFTVMTAFGWDPDVLSRLLMKKNGRSWADLILAFSMKFQSALDERVFNSLRKLDVPVFNLLNIYYGTMDEWRRDPRGLKPLEVGWAIGNPEISGLIEPSVVAGKEREATEGKEEVFVHRAVKENLELLIPRMRAWMALRKKPNREKRVVILFYNNSPGKQSLGASYLNVFASLAVILKRLAREGYRIDAGGKLTRETIHDLILKSGRNIGAWAPGELEEMLEDGRIVRVPVDTYKEWFSRLPKTFRDKVLEQWGPVEDSDIMVRDGSIIMPGVRLGNVMLMPEPSRGFVADPMKLYHSPTLMPHHQYVAAYLWMKYGFHADAEIHLGTHGTHEWLPGKQAGLSPSCPPDVLITDVPSLYPYIVDDVGEGIQAKRRGRGVVIDHMIPAVKRGGLYGEYSRLHDLIGKYFSSAASGAGTAEERLKRIAALAKRLGLDKDIEAKRFDAAALHRLDDYLVEIRSNFMPYGLHRFGVSPAGKARDETAALIHQTRPDLPEKVILRRLELCGPDEMDSLVHGLNGGYIPPGVGNDPLRNPGAIPTGKNFYGFDPARIPSKEAYRLGRRAAERMIRRSLDRRGRYPRKVAIVLWATETIRNEGVNEATMLHLLGMKPVWDKSGRVTGVAAIPAAILKRPRIDVVANASGLYRDLFPNMLEFLDAAVQKASVLTDVENLIRKNTAGMKRRLLESGMSEKQADLLSRIRIFSEKPGNYGNRVSEITASSGLWESDGEIADAYLKHSGYGYGLGKWGAAGEAVLKGNLADTDMVAHSISSTLYGTLDNDDMFQYLGGLALAVRRVSGESPDTVVTVQRRPGDVRVESLTRTIGGEMRTRYLNPSWIEGMKREGYAGAREMSNFVDYLWGWQVTTPFAVDAARWRQTYEVYVEDKYDLGMKEFFTRSNPWAYQSMTARMLESIRKGYWKPAEKVRRRLAAEYAKNVVVRGIACCEHTCNNPALNRMVAGIISIPGVMSPKMAEKFRVAVEKATKKSLKEQAETMRRMHEKVMAGFRKPSDSGKRVEKSSGGTTKPATRAVEGYKMKEIRPRDETTELPSSGAAWYAFAAVLGVLALIAAGIFISGRRSRM